MALAVSLVKSFSCSIPALSGHVIVFTDTTRSSQTISSFGAFLPEDIPGTPIFKMISLKQGLHIGVVCGSLIGTKGDEYSACGCRF